MDFVRTVLGVLRKYDFVMRQRFFRASLLARNTT